ncbi:hypothetical protein EDF62_1046 [Leucobacter luti]|uniref:Uncharacterized protein n=1 Tax=Leucobacter luti TaxID=340320 RepID=A0A4R6S752_9MICO|nr:hypothetical protein EDF62_1046 [Leucobacter luti]
MGSASARRDHRRAERRFILALTRDGIRVELYVWRTVSESTRVRVDPRPSRSASEPTCMRVERGSTVDAAASERFLVRNVATDGIASA